MALLLLWWYPYHTFVQGSEVYRGAAVPSFLVSAGNILVDVQYD